MQKMNKALILSQKAQCELPAVPDKEDKSKEKLVTMCIGKNDGLLKIRTHNSNEPTPSLTDVKFLSNPTRITERVRYQ